MEKIYQVPEYALEKLKKKIKQLSKKAEQLGTSPVEMTVLDDYEDVETAGIVTRLYQVRVTGVAPCLNGWRFVAKLHRVPGGNIIRAVPGESMPERFRSVGLWCEHCNLQRNRKATYVVAKGEQYRQVGSSCLADFTGHRDPHSAAEAAEALIEATEACDDATSVDSAQARDRCWIKIEKYLAHVVLVVGRDGWVSRSWARNNTGTELPTADAALHEMFRGSAGLSDYESPSPEDRETARQTLAWVREELADRDDLNDYTWNLVRSCETDLITHDQIGLVASAIVAYQRALNRKVEQEHSTENSQHVGEVGERRHFDGLTVTAIIPIEGRWGVTLLHKFVDSDGNRLKWFASNAELERGKRYGGRATIKEHGVYNGVRETMLTRCHFERIDQTE